MMSNLLFIQKLTCLVHSYWWRYEPEKASAYACYLQDTRHITHGANTFVCVYLIFVLILSVIC